MKTLKNLFDSGIGTYSDFVHRAYKLGFKPTGRWDAQHHMPALKPVHCLKKSGGAHCV